MAPSAAPTHRPFRTPGHRVIQGLLLVAGAALLGFSAGAGRIDFYWTPLIIGLVYLVAALVDGPSGGYWATAVGFTGWGLAVVYAGSVRPPQIDVAGVYLGGVGLSVVMTALLRARGFAVSEAGLGLTIAAAGAVLALSPRIDALLDASTYALAIAAVGALNVAGGAWGLWRSPAAP